jgi:hypothetical protein
MDQLLSVNDAKDVASKIDAEIHALPVWNTPNERVIRRKYSRKLNQASPEFMLNLAKVLLKNYGYRGVIRSGNTNLPDTYMISLALRPALGF